MGPTAYVGWALLMACQILFGSIIGIFLGEWKGTGLKTKVILTTGLLLLVLTSFLSGYGSRLAQKDTLASNTPIIQATTLAR